MDGPNYLALHGADPGAFLERLERIREIATAIINAIERDSIFLES